MRRVLDPEYYRDLAVYAVVQALDEAQAIGDPDDLTRLAERVVDALTNDTDDPPAYEGWLLVRGEAHRVVDLDLSATDDDLAFYVVATALNKEDPDG